MSKRRVVVTGLGAVTPVGLDVEAFWSAILDGATGFAPITRFDASEFTVHFAAEVKDFEPKEYFSAKEARNLDRFALYALLAGQQAVQDCGLEGEALRKAGCIWASGIGGLEEIERTSKVLYERGPRRISPFFIPKLMLNAAAGQLAIKLGLQGMNFAVASACASGGHAITLALRAIRWGEADVILCGGSEASITPLGVGGFCALRALSERNDDYEHASCPFSMERDGFVVGEGAGGLVVEEYEHAKKRGAKIYCELLGAGMTEDSYHISAPLPEGTMAAAAMTQAAEDGEFALSEIDYVNAHGTSTKLNDAMETRALHRAFGDSARRLMVSSTKSQIGHLLGAAGAVEAVATVLALKQQVVPATMNYVTPDPECDLDYVPNEPREAKIGAAICNSFGFGGHNVTTLFRRM